MEGESRPMYTRGGSGVLEFCHFHHVGGIRHLLLLLWRSSTKVAQYTIPRIMTDVAVRMIMILGSMLAGIAGLVLVQTPSNTGGTYLPPIEEPSKRAYELFALSYTVVWILAFGCIVVFQLYEDFDAWSYIFVCLGLALPFLLQPILVPSAFFDSPDGSRPLFQRYSFKANIWIAMYSFIGNYWYTHCESLCRGYGLNGCIWPSLKLNLIRL